MANASTKSTLVAEKEANEEKKVNFLLPSQGEMHLSANKKYAETVVLVPFYGARKAALKRHIDFLNHLGYDAAVFNLKHNISEANGSFFSANSDAGFKHIWADQTEGILNSIAGNKIVFAFSNPSASAIEAISRRHAVDVKGLICDSGPASDLFTSMVNYYKYQEPVRWLPLRLATALTMSYAWSPNHKKEIHSDLQKLPQNFKILSVRGWKDELISAQNIDGVFDPHSQLDWQRLSLPQAGHLNGLRDFKEDYEEPVSAFLQSISTVA